MEKADVPGGHDKCLVSHEDVVTGTNRTSTEGSRVGLQSWSWLILKPFSTTVVWKFCVQVNNVKFIIALFNCYEGTVACRNVRAKLGRSLHQALASDYH